MTITHKKCAATEKQISEMMFLNAALQSQIEETKVKIGIAKAERKYLLNKLLFYEKEPEQVVTDGDDVPPGGGTSGILQQALSREQSTNKQPSTPTDPQE